MPTASRAFDSVRHQQSSLRDAEGNYGGEEKRDRRRDARIAGRHKRADAARRKDLRPDQNEEDGILDGHAQRNGRETCGKIEVRSEGDLTMKILVIAEHRQGKWNNASFETLAAAQQIAGTTNGSISAVVLGKSIGAFADELAAKAVVEVLAVENELLADYTPDGYCIALKQVVESAKPDLVLFPHTYQVRDFAPKLAALLGKGMIGDCVGYRSEGGKLVFVRQMFQGKTVADVSFLGAGPWFASLQAGAFRADLVQAHASGKAPVKSIRA